MILKLKKSLSFKKENSFKEKRLIWKLKNIFPLFTIFLKNIFIVNKRFRKLVKKVCQKFKYIPSARNFVGSLILSRYFLSGCFLGLILSKIFVNIKQHKHVLKNIYLI